MKKQLLSLVGIFLIAFGAMGQAYVPVTCNGWNWDAVAENTPSTATANVAGIDFQNHCMYSAYYGTLYGTGTGLPNNGTITNGANTYQLQPYTQNNVLYMNTGLTDSLTLPTPTAFSAISILWFATETQSTNIITLEYTDGTVTTYNNVTVQDWFNGTGSILTGYDRLTQPSGTPVFLTTNPRMYLQNYTMSCANEQKLLKTIVFDNISTGGDQRTVVLALSAVAFTPPTLSFTNTDPTCASGSNGQIDVNVTGLTSPFTYAWSTTPAQTTNPATNLVAGPYTVTVTKGGCPYVGYDTLQSGSGTGSLTITAVPDSVCPGGTSLLTASGAVSYTWSAGTPTDSTDLVSPTATTAYSVTATTAGGCTEFGTATVVLKPTPPAPTITASGPTTFCQGDSVVLTSSSASGNIWSTTAITPSITVYATGSFVLIDTVDGCVSPPSAPTSVTVNPIPAPPVITGGPDTFCQGGSVTLTSSDASGNTWNTGSTLQSITVSTSGPYYVTETAGGCTSLPSDTVNVLVNPIPPAPTITSGGPDTFCQGGNVVLSSSAPVGNLWSNTDTTVSITVTASGTYSVTQTLQGCTSPPSAGVVVTVNPLPPAPTISGAPLTFCQGDSVVLTSSAAVGNLWSNTDTTQSITVYASGSFTVTQTASGCTSPPSAPVVVTVNPIPPAPVISASGPTSICIGSSVTLSSSGATGDTWSDGETTASVTISTTDTLTVTQTLLGCTSPPSAPVIVTIIPLPVPVIVPSQPAICAGTPVSLDATTAGATAYLWNNADTIADITIDSPGVYDVTVTVNGCNGSDTVNILSLPLIGTLTLPDSTILCMGDSVTIDATTPNATSYQWTGIEDTTAQATLQTAGGYEVVASNSCGSVSASTIIVTRDCNCNIYVPDAFTPNNDGINDKFMLSYDCPDAEFMDMRIFDRWGEKVFETTDLGGYWDGSFRGSPEMPGIYLYTIEFTALEGTTQHTFHFKGTITLIR